MLTVPVKAGVRECLQVWRKVDAAASGREISVTLAVAIGQMNMRNAACKVVDLVCGWIPGECEMGDVHIGLDVEDD